MCLVSRFLMLIFPIFLPARSKVASPTSAMKLVFWQEVQQKDEVSFLFLWNNALFQRNRKLTFPIWIEKNVLLTYFYLIEGEPEKANVGETLLDAVTAGDHFNIDIQMEEENFTLWMCLCNQHNNPVFCVKYISQFRLGSCVVWWPSEIYPWR